MKLEHQSDGEPFSYSCARTSCYPVNQAFGYFLLKINMGSCGVHSGYSCSDGSWAYLSISSEHFFKAEHRYLSIFLELSIVIWAFFYNWAFISEHYFQSEHFHLSIIFHLSIFIWAFFVIWAFSSEHFLSFEHFHPSFFFTWAVSF